MMRAVGLLLAAGFALAPGKIVAQRATPDSARELRLPPPSVHIATGPARSPLVAGALGFIVPGSGHFYAGEARRGWAVLGITMVGAFFARSDGTPRAVATAGSVLFVGGWTFSVVDGSLAASRYNRRHQD